MVTSESEGSEETTGSDLAEDPCGPKHQSGGGTVLSMFWERQGTGCAPAEWAGRRVANPPNLVGTVVADKDVDFSLSGNGCRRRVLCGKVTGRCSL